MTTTTLEPDPGTDQPTRERLYRRARQLVGRRVEGLGTRLSRLRNPLPEPMPYVPGETPLRRLLWPPALLGFIGSVLVLWGASQPSSPFTLDEYSLHASHMLYLPQAPPWFFGVGPPGRDNIFFGVVAVYGGMVLMFSAWLKLFRLTRVHPGIPLSKFVPVFCAWIAPLLVVAPLFSHDAYSYVGQGEQMTRHANPYQFGPWTLGYGGNPYADYTDSIWLNVTSPYGPVFLGLGDVIMTVVNHSYLGGLVGFRLLAVVGMVMIAVFLPRLARSYGLDPTKAFVLVALNPLLLLHLVGGSHNDALMMGFLVAGLALAREHRPVLGIIICTIGALIKVPALIGVVYIGWDWLGGDIPWRRRIRPLVTAGAISVAVMVILSEAVGLGFGWISALSNPDTVRSWMDPATGLADLLTRIVAGVGLGSHSHMILTLMRGLGGLLAAGIGIRLLWRSRGGTSSLRAIGLTMLAVVLLGPVVQPWYVVWGVSLLAPLAEGRVRIRQIVIAFSIIPCFLGLPGGRSLLHQINVTNPLVVALFCVALVALGAVPLVPRFRRLFKPSEEPEPALLSRS